jgi:nucleoside-diphosphate-sugar epimerase
MNDILFGKTILVTGATGLLGGAIAKSLLEEGHQVRIMVRNIKRAHSLISLGADVVQADMTDRSSLERAVSGCQIVLHFAGALADEFASQAYFHQVNVEGTLHLAEAALSAEVELFLHTSTAWVYGYAASPDTSERSPYLISHDPYIDTKIEAEHRLQQLRQTRGLPLVIVQPSQVYGPGDRHWTLTPLRFIQSGKLILLNGGTGVIQPVYVDDVRTGILAAARNGRIGETYLLCGPEVVTLKRYYGEYARMLGREWLPSIPRWLGAIVAGSMESLSNLTHRQPLFTRNLLRANTMNASYDGSKACEELGFVPKVSLEEGMSRVAAWLAAENPLAAGDTAL